MCACVETVLPVDVVAKHVKSVYEMIMVKIDPSNSVFEFFPSNSAMNMYAKIINSSHK